MMKKVLFVLVFAFISLASSAQFFQQSTGFPQASVGISYICAVDQNILWADGYDGSSSTAPKMQVFTRTQDGGTTWTAGAIPGYSTYGVSMINAIDYNTAWVPLFGPSGGGVILKTTDGGATWGPQPTASFTAPDGFPNVVHFWNANEGFTMGDPNGGYFEIYTTTDGGNDWIRVPQANIPANIGGEYGTTGYYSIIGSTIWFGTNKGRVFKSLDKGLSWTVSTVSSSWSTVRVNTNFLDANHGVAQHRGTNAGGAATGEKYETYDGGTTWSLMVQSGPLYTASFAWVPGLPNTMVASGSATGEAGIAYSPDGGHTWTDFDTTAGYQFLFTVWTDNTHGWAGSFTDQTDPANVGGMWKFDNVLTDILNIDPKQGGVKIYPNPGNGRFTCAIIGFENKDVNISIYNTVGQKVYEQSVNQSLISYNEYIDISSFESGLYIARIQSGSKVITEKITVK